MLSLGMGGKGVRALVPSQGGKRTDLLDFLRAALPSLRNRWGWSGRKVGFAGGEEERGTVIHR